MDHTLTYKVLSSIFTAITTTLKSFDEKPTRVELKPKFEIPTIELLYSENYHPLQRKPIFPFKANPFEDVQTVN